MIRCGWLADQPGYIGGAELTQAEFRAAAPKGVCVVDCPPGGVVPGLDRYVAHNLVTYVYEDVEATGGNVHWYHHDMGVHVPTAVKGFLDPAAVHIFCSPLQRKRYGRHGVGSRCIPPPVDLARFKPTRQTERHRKGTCAVAQWHNPAKGARAVAEWAEDHGPVDVYGGGPFAPVNAPNIDFKGEVPAGEVEQVLWRYERFVFLPQGLEPFGRCVIEAWASGCVIVTNVLVGARHYIERDQAALDTAAADFWGTVLA